MRANQERFISGQCPVDLPVKDISSSKYRYIMVGGCKGLILETDTLTVTKIAGVYMLAI